MKSLVVYYSHTGNTAYVADKLASALRTISEVDILELEYYGSRSNILKRLLFRAFPDLVPLAPVKTELKEYDLLCLGIAVMGGYPPAALTKYIRICKDMEGKKIICLLVYGIEASAKSCAYHIGKTLQRRNVSCLHSIYVPWFNAYNAEFLEQAFGECLRKLS
jgi:hypothetical protein